MSSEADEGGLDLFQEPNDYYEPEKQATSASHQLLSGKELTVRLVGHNPLWVRIDSSLALRKIQNPSFAIFCFLYFFYIFLLWKASRKRF